MTILDSIRARFRPPADADTDTEPVDPVEVVRDRLVDAERAADDAAAAYAGALRSGLLDAPADDDLAALAARKSAAADRVAGLREMLTEAETEAETEQATAAQHDAWGRWRDADAAERGVMMEAATLWLRALSLFARAGCRVTQGVPRVPDELWRLSGKMPVAGSSPASPTAWAACARLGLRAADVDMGRNVGRAPAELRPADLEAVAAAAEKLKLPKSARVEPTPVPDFRIPADAAAESRAAAEEAEAKATAAERRKTEAAIAAAEKVIAAGPPGPREQAGPLLRRIVEARAGLSDCAPFWAPRDAGMTERIREVRERLAKFEVAAAPHVPRAPRIGSL